MKTIMWEGALGEYTIRNLPVSDLKKIVNRNPLWNSWINDSPAVIQIGVKFSNNGFKYLIEDVWYQDMDKSETVEVMKAGTPIVVKVICLDTMTSQELGLEILNDLVQKGQIELLND